MEGTYRAYSLLDSINKKFGPHDFGRLCQILLGITFKKLYYKIPLFQLSGRPDMIIVKNGTGFSIEVKAPTKYEVTLKKEDIDGVTNQGYQPMICVNTYPEVKPKWLLLDANNVKAGTFRSSSLERFSLKKEQDEVNNIFLEILERYQENSLKGTECLMRVLNEI